ncbi:MAG: iron-containing alcohol dehydrogenase [Gammaproteobacteria bacterium]|nr:iron-containing alcohol dehydrogenase [Gammaproteobacteria bacterium]
MGCQYFDTCEHGSDSFTVDIPKVTFGRGCLQEVGARAALLGMSRVALFTDPLLKEGSYVESVGESLNAAGVDFAVFSEIRIEADDASVERGARFLTDGDFDGMISVGGGKTMPGPLLKHIACPTTSGTGSECTSISVIRITALGTKFVLANPVMLANQALIDPACCDCQRAKRDKFAGYRKYLCCGIEL